MQLRYLNRAQTRVEISFTNTEAERIGRCASEAGMAVRIVVGPAGNVLTVEPEDDGSGNPT